MGGTGKRAKKVSIRRTPEEPGDLVGAVEASEILGVERTRIARYVRTGVMPRPVSKLRATSVWLRSDVEELAERRALAGGVLRPSRKTKDGGPRYTYRTKLDGRREGE